MTAGRQDDTKGPEEAIRRVRAESNAALARRDVTRLARCWAPDYAIVTSTNVHAVGRAASIERMHAAYLAKPDMAIARDPVSIEIHQPWGMAAETGRWESSWTEPTGRMTLGGTYFAKWQKYLDAGWLIQAEVYVPTFSTGSPGSDRPLPYAAAGTAD
jgi:ketosteroid isomerase-like protein